MRETGFALTAVKIKKPSISGCSLARVLGILTGGGLL